MKKYKVLLACMYHDFGQTEMAPDFSNASWEYHNIYQSWKQLEDDGVVELKVHWVNVDNNPQGFERLISLARDVDFVFQVAVNHGLSICLPYAHQIIEDGTPIIDYPPDIWARFDHHTSENWIVGRYKEGYVTHYLSPARHVMELMEQNNLPVRYMPFGIAANCDRLDAEKIYDVSFVGQKHGIRDTVVNQITAAGIELHLFGHFWDGHPNWHGRPGADEMNLIFNQSKINLNFRWASRNPNWALVNGRSFELPGAGAFMIATQHNETNEFNELFVSGEEFAECHLVDDMIKSIRYYLEHDDARERMADAAYQRREEHLWTTRFKEFLAEWEEWK